MWKRKIDRKPMRLVIYLSPDEDEALYKWLESIPYGKTSKSIREALRNCLAAESGAATKAASVEVDDIPQQADKEAVLKMADRIRSLHEL